jgi:hypothetical protein
VVLSSFLEFVDGVDELVVENEVLLGVGEVMFPSLCDLANPFLIFVFLS